MTGIYDVLTETKGKERSKVTIAVDETRMIYTEHSSTWDGKCRNFVTMPDGSPMKKKMTLDAFQKNLQGIIEVSTDKSAPKPEKPKPAPVEAKPKAEKPKDGKRRWECKVCGYIYEGDSLPDDFVCPLCKHGAEDFVEII